MFRQVDEEFKKYCLMDGSYLKKLRSIGGGSAALSVTGFLVAVFAVVLIVALGDSVSTEGKAVLAGVAAVCVLLGVWGIVMNGKRKNSYLEYYSKKSGYTPAQLQEFDRELLEPGSRYYSTEKKLNKNSAGRAMVQTKNWLMVTFDPPVKLADIAAAFYFKGHRYVKGMEVMNDFLFLYADGRVDKLTEGLLSREDATRFVAELAKLNPYLITAEKIEIGGQAYSCLDQSKEVAKLYCDARNGKL